MPIDYSRDDRDRRITVVNRGDVTLAELLAVLDRQAAEGTWSYSMLYDAQSTTFRPSNADVRKLANRAGSLTRRHGRRGRVAVVTPQPAAYEKAQTYSHLAEAFDIPMRVFLNRSSAERWLNDSRATDAPTEPA